MCNVEFLKKISICSCLWKATIQEYFQNKAVVRGSHQHASKRVNSCLTHCGQIKLKTLSGVPENRYSLKKKS